jgi:5'-3' exonuclease
MTTPKTDCYLIDASIYVFRAWFSVPDNFLDRDGNPANAVFGFAGFLIGLLEQVKPSHLGIAFDESLESSFRNEIYPQYKANRDPAPVELKRQFSHCRAVAEGLGIDCFSDHRFEADDLIGTLATRKRQVGHQIHIVSSDKDLAQLLEAGETLWDLARNQRLDSDGIMDKFGVRPEQIADFLALTGDAVDNIPGVPGIGPKTASALLGHFGTLDELLGRIDEVGFLSIRGAKSLAVKLRNHEQDARLARRLTEIATDAPIPEPEPSLAWRGPDLEELEDLFDYLGFGQGLRRRCRRLGGN